MSLYPSYNDGLDIDTPEESTPVTYIIFLAASIELRFLYHARTKYYEYDDNHLLRPNTWTKYQVLKFLREKYRSVSVFEEYHDKCLRSVTVPIEIPGNHCGICDRINL